MNMLLKTALCLGAAAPVITFAVSEAVASRGSGEKEADYLLILGHALKDNAPTQVLVNRCESAAEYLKKYENTVAIACGGITGEGQIVSEAEVIKELLVKSGIPEERIVLEDKSTTTAENFYNAKKLMGETAGATVLLLSSDYHLLRARKLAKICGIDAGTVSAPTPSDVRIKCFVKEFFAFPFMFFNLKEAKKNG